MQQHARKPGIFSVGEDPQKQKRPARKRTGHDLSGVCYFTQV
jgi:hypothetical protein